MNLWVSSHTIYETIEQLGESTHRIATWFDVVKAVDGLKKDIWKKIYKKDQLYDNWQKEYEELIDKWFGR